MKTGMAKTSEDFSSKTHFRWTNKVTNEEEEETAPTLKPEHEKEESDKVPRKESQRRKLQGMAVSRLRSVLAVFGKNQSHWPLGLGSKVIGTLFGYRHGHGHVHFAFQKDANSEPAFLIQLATPISVLVREMASGLVRIALECDKDEEEDKEEEKKAVRTGRGRRRRRRLLLEESRWRTYCNGKKCGFATRRECGPKEWKVLKAVEPISMGAGVLPETNGGGGEEFGGDGGSDGGEVMYMRAKFERVVGSRDSEAFYMMNPDSNGAPELSIYLLRV
ncbi:hypothetical protein CsSME_00053912 [Camellia sinensis var. sinensis]